MLVSVTGSKAVKHTEDRMPERSKSRDFLLAAGAGGLLLAAMAAKSHDKSQKKKSRETVGSLKAEVRDSGSRLSGV